MSKELIRPREYRKSEPTFDDTELKLNEEQKKELAQLYEGTFEKFKVGSLITGKVIQVSPEGVLIDIDYKSDGLIPLYEFSQRELKQFSPGSKIDVIIDELENQDGNILVSYEKAKASKAWDEIIKLYEKNQPVEGVVTHKVKGGLSVDIGIPAFLPGSQVDIQRVADFDKFVGQTITANIIKINQKRGNVIISRRKYLNEQRAESRKKIIDTLQENQIIQGTVKNITNYGVFIDIGGVDGLLHITDMTWGRIAHPSELVKIGDTITVKVLSFDKVNEKISLGMKQLTENPWAKLPEDITIGSKIKGKISSITDYGLFIEVLPGVEGLVHISEISWIDRITDLNKLYKVGDEIEALVVSLDKENRRMSLSIKQLEENPWDKIEEEYKIDQKIKGKVSNITEFGIFVQLAPGIDGLIHISDLSWTEHIEHPADKFKKDDEVEAVIIGINKENKKISLGIKQLTPNPWDEIEKNHPVGSIVEGEITNATKFGTYVKLPNGIEGLIPPSEIPSPEDGEEKLKEGQKVKCRVIKLNKDDHKLLLSLKTEKTEKPKSATKNGKKEKTTKTSKEKKVESAAPKTQLQLELEKLRKKEKESESKKSKK